MDIHQEKNLIPIVYSKDIEWDPDSVFEKLDIIHQFVIDECRRAIKWYYLNKGFKSKMGYLLRVGSIVSVATAGVIPIIGEIFKQDGIPLISPAWSTVAFAIAALFIALDQFGGYTSGWVRYVRTAQRLVILQGNFQLEWEAHRLSRLEENSNHIELGKYGILLCKDFLQSVYLEVQAETNAWAQEFQQILVDVEASSKPKSVNFSSDQTIITNQSN